MSRRDTILRAKELIAARRAESIAAYERHILEVSEKFPEMRTIDRELSLTGSKIMAAALAKENVAEAISSIRAEYDSLVLRKRSLLTSNGYPADYCDIKYCCPDCSDTGYVGIDMCSCLKRELISGALADSGLYSLIQNQGFDSFSLDFYGKEDRGIMQQNVSILKDFAANFTPGKADSFLFLGGTGLGKTHLSSAVAQAVIERGYYVVYESSLKLFGDFELQRFGNGGYGLENDTDVGKYLECDLLIIDDLGCELTNQFTVSCLYNIINTRIIQHRSTIISTNLTQQELRNRYSDRILSRIFGEFKPLVFRGTDVREQKIRKKYNK